MIWHLGSIYLDHVYRVDRLPGAGENLVASDLTIGLGGRGAHVSIAAARAGARVAHIGAVGYDGAWIIERLLECGVDTDHIGSFDQSAGRASILVDPAGDRIAVFDPGPNAGLTEAMIGAALSEASTGDILLMQNDTSGQLYAARTARTLGLRTIYAAAPFDAERVAPLVGLIDTLILNAKAAEELAKAMRNSLRYIGVPNIVVTFGAAGCKWINDRDLISRVYPAYEQTAVSATGAGDTFAGFLAGSLARGLGMEEAIDLAQRAAALRVLRHGMTDAIPDLKEVQDHDFTSADKGRG